jgi:hypothetical protein
MDLDFGRGDITLCRGKDLRDRITMLPGDLLVADEKGRVHCATELLEDLR